MVTASDVIALGDFPGVHRIGPGVMPYLDSSRDSRRASRGLPPRSGQGVSSRSWRAFKISLVGSRS